MRNGRAAATWPAHRADPQQPQRSARACGAASSSSQPTPGSAAVRRYAVEVMSTPGLRRSGPDAPLAPGQPTWLIRNSLAAVFGPALRRAHPAGRRLGRRHGDRRGARRSCRSAGGTCRVRAPCGQGAAGAQPRCCARHQADDYRYSRHAVHRHAICAGRHCADGDRLRRRAGRLRHGQADRVPGFRSVRRIGRRCHGCERHRPRRIGHGRAGWDNSTSQGASSAGSSKPPHPARPRGIGTRTLEATARRLIVPRCNAVRSTAFRDVTLSCIRILMRPPTCVIGHQRIRPWTPLSPPVLPTDFESAALIRPPI